MRTRLTSQDTFLCILDVQALIATRVFAHEAFIFRLIGCTRILKLLDVPVMVSEQYPKGLGPTISQLTSVLGEDYVRIEKLDFDAFREPSFSQARKGRQFHHRKNILIAGLETHICVLQTAMGALENGLQPYVIADAISSRFSEDHRLGLSHMEALGVGILSSEMVVTELLGSARHPEFRACHDILKESQK